MKEFDLIQKHFKPLTKDSKACQDLNDDVAKISIKPGEELIISKDMMIEDVHFLLKDGAYKIASKLLLSNLSDLASSGAKPLYYMLGFSKNDNLSEDFYQEFAKGLENVQDEFNLCLIGGDTVFSDKLCFSITIFGSIKKSQNLARNKAKDGDLIFITENIGEAFLGRTNPDNYPQDLHFFPKPKVDFAHNLAKKGLSKCAIDVSDGFLADLNHLCNSSKLDAIIDFNKIPFSKRALKFLKDNPSIKKLDLLSSGEDYEIIFSCNKKNLSEILKLSKKFKVKISEIGRFEKNQNGNYQIKLLDKNNKKINIKKFGYEH